MSKPWRSLIEAEHHLYGQLGVFQLADASNNTIYIGFAGGRSRFGLKEEVISSAAKLTKATQYRVEITSAYHSRYRELIMLHVADHGTIPTANPPINLGKLNPITSKIREERQRP